MITRLEHPVFLLSFTICVTGLFPPAATPLLAQTTLKLAGLRTEYKENSLGIDTRKPRLSWQIRSDARGLTQSAYQVRVARGESDLHTGSNLAWDSGKANSDESIHRAYDGPLLQSGRRYYWQVRVWDGSGAASDWSEPAYWETGLLQPSDWQANRIEPDLPEDVSRSGPAPILRRSFKVNGAVEWARAYVTRLKVQGTAGATVVPRHAEVLDKQGNFYTENLRVAKATMKYTLSVPVSRAQPLWVSGGSLPLAPSRGLLFVALPGQAGGDHHLGAVGRPEAGRVIPG